MITNTKRMNLLRAKQRSHTATDVLRELVRRLKMGSQISSCSMCWISQPVRDELLTYTSTRSDGNAFDIWWEYTEAKQEYTNQYNEWNADLLELGRSSLKLAECTRNLIGALQTELDYLLEVEAQIDELLREEAKEPIYIIAATKEACIDAAKQLGKEDVALYYLYTQGNPNYGDLHIARKGGRRL